MSNQLIPSNEFQVEISANSGISTERSLNTESISNGNLLETYDINTVLESPTPLILLDSPQILESDNTLLDIPTTVEEVIVPQFIQGTCFDNLNSEALIDNIDKLYAYLCEVLIRFDASPQYYQKEDYELLIKTITNSLIYLYNQNILITSEIQDLLTEISNKIDEAPIDDSLYGRKNGEWFNINDIIETDPVFEAWLNTDPLPVIDPNTVIDSEYVHTDNNYSNADKSLLESALQSESDPVWNSEKINYQTRTDVNLTTQTTNVIDAINEVNSLALGAQQALSYDSYETLIGDALGWMTDDPAAKIGQSYYIETIDVPDLWMSKYNLIYSPYEYIDDLTFIDDIKADVPIGYFNFSLLETGKVNLADYVPYTGATGDVNLGNHTIATDAVKIDTVTPYVVQNPGDIGWNPTDGTFDMKLLNGTTLQAGQEIHFYGKAVGNIQNGDVLQFAGVQGDHILMKKAVPSEINQNPHYLVGIATDNISNGSFGYSTWFGKINGVYTTGMSISPSPILYFDFTTGGLTNTEPTPPNRKIIIAAVIKLATGSAENGVLLVRPTFGMKLSDLDDVNGTPLSTTGQILVWNNELGVHDFTKNINDYAKLSGGNTFSNAQTFNDKTYFKNKISVTTDGSESTDGGSGSFISQGGVYTSGYMRIGNMLYFSNNDIRTTFGTNLSLFNNKINFNSDGDYIGLIGRYNYQSSSLSADTVNDTRFSSSGGVITFQKCTVASGTKGGGTWVTILTNELKTINGNSIKGSGDITIASTDASVVQTSGTSTSDVISQKGITDNFAQKNQLDKFIINDQSKSYSGNRQLPFGKIVLDSSDNIYAVNPNGSALGGIWAWDKFGNGLWHRGYYPEALIQFNDMGSSVSLLDNYLFTTGDFGKYLVKTNLSGAMVTYLDGGTNIRYKFIETIGTYLYIIINNTSAATWTLATYDSSMTLVSSVLLDSAIYSTSVLNGDIYLGGTGKAMRYNSSLSLLNTYTTSGMGSINYCPVSVDPIYNQIAFADTAYIYLFLKDASTFRYKPQMSPNTGNIKFLQNYGDNFYIISGSGYEYHTNGGSGSILSISLNLLNRYIAQTGTPVRKGDFIYVPSTAGVFRLYSKIT